MYKYVEVVTLDSFKNSVVSMFTVWSTPSTSSGPPYCNYV